MQMRKAYSINNLILNPVYNILEGASPPVSILFIDSLITGFMNVDTEACNLGMLYGRCH
jgi:hypothetical protein